MIALAAVGIFIQGALRGSFLLYAPGVYGLIIVDTTYVVLNLYQKKGVTKQMQKLYGMNDWGIYVPHDEVLNGTLKRNKLEEAGYSLIHPLDGELYMDATGEYIKAKEPFWFLPIQQPSLFETFYESMKDIENEVTPLYPEVFFDIAVEERLCRANVVCGE